MSALLDPAPVTAPVRLVAVDMDGTFLHSDNTYDRPRFARVHAAMRQAGCRFVVASGNQYEQLASFFTDVDDVAYVAENGALVREGDEVLFAASIAPEAAARVVAALEAESGLEFIACGPEGAFVLDTATDAFVERMSVYYHRLSRVASLDGVLDRLFKSGLDDPDGLPEGLAERLTAAVGDVVLPVTSGHSSVDLIVPGCHKASGLLRLMERWGIRPGESAAFGDSANDAEMLRLVGYGIAMANASDAARSAARYSTASNEVDGVLAVLESWFFSCRTTGEPPPAEPRKFGTVSRSVPEDFDDPLSEDEIRRWE